MAKTSVRQEAPELLAGLNRKDQTAIRALARIALEDSGAIRWALVAYARQPFASDRQRRELRQNTASHTKLPVECRAMDAASRAIGSNLLYRVYRPENPHPLLKERLAQDPGYSGVYRAWAQEPYDKDRYQQAGALYLANLVEEITGCETDAGSADSRRGYDNSH